MDTSTTNRIIYGLTMIGMTALISWVVITIYGADSNGLDAIVTGVIGAIAGMTVPRVAPSIPMPPIPTEHTKKEGQE